MKVSNAITPAVIQAATGLLQVYCPDLSPKSLVAALKNYGGADTTGTTAPAGKAVKPLTRKEVADLLSCSLQSINRYLNQGKLRRIRLSPKSVRICPDSVSALLAGEAADTSKEG